MPNPYVFIVGAPRSGTTLLQRIVDAHPQIAITPESHWLASFYLKRKGITKDGYVTPKLIRKLLAHHKFPCLGLSRHDLKEAMGTGEPVHYSSFVSRLFDRYGRTRGKELVGDKTPGYAREVRTLHSLWPAARFIHLIRDGRDVCLSALDWHRPGKLLSRLPIWSEDRVTTAALWWEWHVRLCRQAGRNLPPNQYYELSYESLVARPEEACAALCDFLGVPITLAMIRFHQNAPRSDQADHRWTPVTAGLRDWRFQMSPEDIERFEAAVRPLLEELGYAPGLRLPGSDKLEHARRLRALLAQDARPQGYELPAGW
jgi:hypothetical protein